MDTTTHNTLNIKGQENHTYNSLSLKFSVLDSITDNNIHQTPCSKKYNNTIRLIQQNHQTQQQTAKHQKTKMLIKTVQNIHSNIIESYAPDNRQQTQKQRTDTGQHETTVDDKLLYDLAHWQRIIQILAQGSVIALLLCQCVKCVLLHSVAHHHISDILIHTIAYNAYTILYHAIQHYIIQYILYIPYLHTLLYMILYSAYILIRSYTLMLPHHHMICYYSIKTYTSYLHIRHLLPCLIL